ncbi:hypothetical protein FOC4_g10012222 [Fusarium odoratissimum]|uniref:Uncharacterized protein n=2 Tax=Fusarium oxysporum species complex TaxID=171631 RepID=N1R7H0_FUSC4|nr:hypothetical protein FOC4_g10012222 [Fusarium odoratissimum]TXC11342.1 hypothetical protein FocTR4_00006204 [Fusarium oxysporum f. sp. cubense]
MSSPSPDQQDIESVSSVDSFDPAPTLAFKKITREEALEQTSEHIGKMCKSKFLDKLLKPAVSKWLTEPTLRVLAPLFCQLLIYYSAKAHVVKFVLYIGI